jgi:hypothetical protein
MYGAKAELSDVALAVKGNLKAQFKITSGEQELRTEIFAINNGEALDAGDGDWAGDLDGHNLDEMAQDIEDTKAAVSEMESDVSELKSGLSEMQTATAKDVGKALKAKTVTDGKVTEWEFGEAGGADPEEIEQAVSDWLDEHPEATTTVEDGSITEAKLVTALIPTLKNNYVTPQMYGAVGDGVADDTEALQDAFDSGYDVYIPDGTYMTSGIDIANKTNITFGNVILKANTDYQPYIVNVTAPIYTRGTLILEGNNRKALVGIRFSGASKSVIDGISVSYTLLWGVIIGSPMVVNRIDAAYCGYSVPITASYKSNYILSIDNKMGGWESAVLESEDTFPCLLNDNSGYVSMQSNSWVCRINSYDSETSELKAWEAAANKVPSDYLSKDCYLLGGGAVKIIGVSGLVDIMCLDTRLGPVGLGMYTQYGQFIHTMYSQSDRVVVYTNSYNLGTFYGSMTAESVKSGYWFVSDYYDYSLLGLISTNYNNPLYSNQVQSIANGNNPRTNPLLAEAILRRLIPGGYKWAGTVEINEQTGQPYIIRNNDTIILSLIDNSYRGDGFQGDYNPWGLKILHFMPTAASSGNITIKCSDTLKNAGYTIRNGTDGELIFTRPSSFFKAYIYLLNKEFVVSTETIQIQEADT